MTPIRKTLAVVYNISSLTQNQSTTWNFVQQIALFNEVIIITQSANRKRIETLIENNGNADPLRFHMVYFDLPASYDLLKKSRFGSLLHNHLWQKRLPEHVKNLGLDFDMVHDLSFQNEWSASYVWKLKKPYVLGPVSAIKLIPRQYLSLYHGIHFLKDRMYWMLGKSRWFLLPSVKKVLKHADSILCSNASVAGNLGIEGKKVKVISYATASDEGFSIDFSPKQFNLVSAGEFIPENGFDLCILAFADFVLRLSEQERVRYKLTLAGDGPQLHFLHHLVIENKVERYVEFVSLSNHGSLAALLKRSCALILTSHVGGDSLLAEGLSYGLPVICLENTNADGLIDRNCGIVIAKREYGQTVVELSNAIHSFFTNNRHLLTMRINARQQFEKKLTWEILGTQLQNIYSSIHPFKVNF